MNPLRRFSQLEDGQDMVEYALLASLVALAAMGAVQVLGNHLDQFFWSAIGPSI